MSANWPGQRKSIPELDDWARQRGALTCWGCARCHAMFHKRLTTPHRCPNCGTFDSLLELETHTDA